MTIFSRIILPPLLGALTLAGTCVVQADDCVDLSTVKQKTYGFQPRKLSKKEQEKKGKELDKFWNLAKASGEKGILCVKKLMEAEQVDTYFLFDGASLLAHFDRSGKSDAAILDGLTRTDLEDLDPAGYIEVALQISRRGSDIGPVARKYLYHPNVTTYLARHGGYKLDRTPGAILLYGSMQPSLVDKYLSQEISSANLEVRNTAAIVWSLNMTAESFKTLATLGQMKDFSEVARAHVRVVLTHKAVIPTRPSKYTREQMLQKLAKFPELDPNIDDAENRALDNSVYATFTIADFDAMREGRRKLITGVSNESVDGYMEMSRVLLNLINALDAYKESRAH